MDQSVILASFGLIGGAVAFGYGFGIWRRLRLIQDTPTAKVRSLPLGRVELHGRAQQKAELSAPISGKPCVWYRYKVQERRGSGKNSRWVTIDEGDSSAWGFYLEDGTGAVLILPDGAKVDVSADLQRGDGSLNLLSGSYRERIDTSRWESRGLFGRKSLQLTEWRIVAGEPLYVLGVAQERGSLAQERRERIAEKLRALKSDPEAMAHFDTDGDGQISPEEWEIARQLSIQQVTQQGVEDRVVVAADPERSAPFYVSDRGEGAVLWRHRWRSALGIYGGALLSVACLYYLLRSFGIL